jgi:hypothetical protein
MKLSENLVNNAIAAENLSDVARANFVAIHGLNAGAVNLISFYDRKMFYKNNKEDILKYFLKDWFECNLESFSAWLSDITQERVFLNDIIKILILEEEDEDLYLIVIDRIVNAIFQDIALSLPKY